MEKAKWTGRVPCAGLIVAGLIGWAAISAMSQRSNPCEAAEIILAFGLGCFCGYVLSR